MDLDAVVTDEDRKHLFNWMEFFDESIEDKIALTAPSVWAENKRILPPGLTSMPGSFRWSTTPYLKEIIDLFSPFSPVQKVSIMKGAQVGVSVGLIENLIGWIIDESPGPTLFITADRELAEAVVETRVDRMIESAGLSGKIFSQVEKSHGKKTGDTKKKKEFAGGFLLPLGPSVAGKLRSFSIKTIFFDEVDGFPLSAGLEGDPIKLAERRTDAFTGSRKILYISTPTLEDTSRIKPLFEKGDQSRFFIPCTKCLFYQYLKWGQIKYIVEDGRLIYESVGYECENCSHMMKNSDKSIFLEKGTWRPTAVPSEPNFRSFHLSSLYSPIGFRPWESLVSEFLDAKSDHTKLRVFVNTVLGETWQERGEAPAIEKVLLKREDWVQGTLPEDAEVLLITLGADVQKDRIEVEIVGWGEGKESWSLDYLVLEGDTSDLRGTAWSALREVISCDFRGIGVSMAFIDCGFRTSLVYAFCEDYSFGVMPCMGEESSTFAKKIFSIRDVSGFSSKRVDLFTSLLKSEFYGYVQLSPSGDGTYPQGYCHFPSSYTEKHFIQLLSEERVKQKTKSGAVRYIWKQKIARNEQLDCRIYAMGALYAFASYVSDDMSPGAPIPWASFWKMAKG